MGGCKFVTEYFDIFSDITDRIDMSIKEQVMAVKDISETGFSAVSNVDSMRKDIMAAVAEIAGGATNNTSGNYGVQVDYSTGTGRLNFGSVATMAGLGPNTTVDITTGAGALVLDDVLQVMSTMQQSAAQLVAAENKAQQQVNSLARQ
jgi:hypothetical protein